MLESLSVNTKKKPGTIARINLIAMWRDDYFAENTFVDLGNEHVFRLFFPEPAGGYVKVGEKKFRYDWARQKASNLQEVLIGTRGPWWVPYANIVTVADGIETEEASGYTNLA